MCILIPGSGVILHIPTIVHLLIVQASRIRAFENPVAHQYHYYFDGAIPEPKKTFYVRPIQDDTCRALRRLVEFLKEKGTHGYIYDVESFFWALKQLHGSFRDIGAHQDFQMPEFFMPELLIKEL